MNRNLIYIVTFGILLVIVCGILMSPVKAYDRVPQGGTVFLGERYDISGVMAGYDYLVFTGEYLDVYSPDNTTITYTITMPQQRELYYNFSIDPEIFSTRLGWWYHFNGLYNSHGNDRAFKVMAVRPPLNETANNGTYKNATVIPESKPIVPERHIADYLVARGDPLNLTFSSPNKTTCWIFGRLYGIYDRPVKNQTVHYNASELVNFEPGPYTIMFHSMGNDQNFDVRVNGDKLEYFDPNNFHVYSLNIASLTPELIKEKILEFGGGSDDIFTMKTLQIQNPYIEITNADMNQVTALTGVLQVRGYTNLQNNSALTFILDKDRTLFHEVGNGNLSQNIWYDTVKEYDNPGSMRYFDFGIPIVWSELAPTPTVHDITVRGSHNTSMIVPLHIYEAPVGSPIPNQSVKYIGGNLFVPTPTPEVIIKKEIVTQVVTQIVQVPVTPSDEQVHAQQEKVTWETISTIAQWVFFAIVMIVLGLYLIRYYYQRKEGV